MKRGLKWNLRTLWVFVLAIAGCLRAQDITGSWQGTITPPQGTPHRMVLRVIHGDSGAFKARTRGYASRLAPEGVTVNAVAPGLIDTEMGQPLIEAGVVARIPVGRSGTGEEIAQAVMLLVRDGFITGQTLAVNGGGLFS